MSDHYYSNKPQSDQVLKVWEFALRGNTFTFKSSAGVFSKSTVDFGSRLLIETFEQPGVSGKILDLGCGYGPVGISIAKDLPEREVVMVDINERAIVLAKENAATNAVSNVDVKQSDGFLQVEEHGFSAILTNPPIRAGKKVVHGFFKESANRLVAGGELWIVIQKKQGAPSAIKYLQVLYDEVIVVARDKGYYIIRARKAWD